MRYPWNARSSFLSSPVIICHDLRTETWSREGIYARGVGLKGVSYDRCWTTVLHTGGRYHAVEISLSPVRSSGILIGGGRRRSGSSWVTAMGRVVKSF